jgi:23S rRNA (cytidine1920-2'-O)/16S rRNA (cytidine1409-2'-O)-methyltransferase
MARRRVPGVEQSRVTESMPGRDAATNVYASRGGLKLRHALDVFAIDVRGFACVDLGCSTGGFTDCLVQAGAACVVAVDTAYGELAWKLRQDPRVVVMERTNALHAVPPQELNGGVDLAVADIGWTPQRLVIPAALKWLKPGGRIITLIKPHYERSDRERSDRERSDAGAAASGRRGAGKQHVLSHADALAETRRVCESFSSLGVRLLGLTESPILGGHATKAGAGNSEWLAWLERLGESGEL